MAYQAPIKQPRATTAKLKSAHEANQAANQTASQAASQAAGFADRYEPSRMTSDMILGAILGALIISAALSVGQAIGLIHIGLGREQREAAQRPAAPPAPVAPAPRLGCSITVEARSNPNAEGLTPQVRLFATIDNQGVAPVRALRGYWRVMTPDKFKHPQIRIERGILAPHNQYLESYLLDEGVDMQGEGVRFDVEVEFDYMAHSDTDNRHYSAKFRYDRKYHRMIRL